MEVCAGCPFTGREALAVINLQAPLWLFLLILIPLIRWMHRFKRLSSTHPSTTLFLWHSFQHHQGAGGSPASPDRLWLLRALITILLVLALADPALQNGQGHSIEVWLDDSLSMFTEEDEQRRIHLALKQLGQYLAETEASQIQLHSLGNPGSSITLDPGNASGWPDQLGRWTDQPQAEPLPPPAATLSPLSNHILLTDGADIELNRWARSAPLRHVIQAGRASQNIALTRLSLRKPLDESGIINGVARIDNLTDTAQNIRLILQHEKEIIKTQQLDIPAHEKTIITFSIADKKRGQILARLEGANDPLPLDDELRLNLEKLNPALRYKKLGRCSQHVEAVLDSHPSLMQADSEPEVIIDCSGEIGESILPLLRLQPTHSLLRTTHKAHWHNNSALQSLVMAAGLPYSDRAPALSSTGSPILSANGRMLILKQAETDRQIIESYISSSDPLFALYPEYPLLITGLLGQLTGRNLDMAPLTASRETESSRIKPNSFSIKPMELHESQSMAASIAPLLILASLILLTVDAAIATGLIHRMRKRY